MFSNLFNKKSALSAAGIFEGRTEWHCHLLPGVDDGAQTLDDTVALLSLYEHLGYDTLWLTPHIMEDIPNETAALRQRFSELEEKYHSGALPGLKGNLKLHLAAENMLDTLFEARLDAGDLLPLGDKGNQLLVETSFFNPPFNLHELLEKVKSKGFYPVLAHPERYRYMEEKDYDRLKKMNIRFQLNLPSLSGMYGPTAMKKAEMLLKKGYYELCGCDTHRVDQLRLVSENKVSMRIIHQLRSL